MPAALLLHKHQEACLAALSVALKHSTLAAKQQNICTLLQVSKAVQAVLQQSAAGVTDIQFSCEMRTSQLHKVASFAAWLERHLGLVQSITNTRVWTLPDAEWKAVQTAVQQLIQLSFKAAGSAAGLAGGSSVSTIMPIFPLGSYSSNIPVSAGLFAALPAGSLTRLEVQAPENGNWLSGLSKLRHLRELRLGGKVPGDWAVEFSKLTQLTNLQLLGIDEAAVSNLQQLPTQLQYLKILALYNLPSPSVLMNLQHLVCLRQLDLTHGGNLQFANGCALPAQLQHLKVLADAPVVDVLGLSGLQQLETLELHSVDEGGKLMQLTTLGRLQHLALRCPSSSGAGLELDRAAACKYLAALRQLEIGYIRDIGVQQWQTLVQHLAALSLLTMLDVRFGSIRSENGVVVYPSSLVVCEHLRSLVQLKELTLIVNKLDVGVQGQLLPTQDAQHLTALTALRQLSLSYFPYVDTTTLALLALKLTNLELLDIGGDSQGLGTAALPAIASLSNLQSLSLPSNALNETDAQRGLLLLTGLTRLTELLGFEQAGSEALDTFWARVRS